MCRIKLNSFICREKLSEVHDELQKKEAALAELQPDVSQNRKSGFFCLFIFSSLWIYVVSSEMVCIVAGL